MNDFERDMIVVDEHADQHLLVVDDEPITRAILSSTLGSHFTVWEASSGAEAIEIAKLHGAKIGLVLLDFFLPDCTGDVVMQRLRTEAGCRAPVVFLTSHSAMEAEVHCLDAGAIDYLRKPVRTEQLLSRVNRHINEHSLAIFQEVQAAFLQSLLKRSAN